MWAEPYIVKFFFGDLFELVKLFLSEFGGITIVSFIETDYQSSNAKNIGQQSVL